MCVCVIYSYFVFSLRLPFWNCSLLCSSFDLLTNGGIAISLRVERAPFITQEHTLSLPWGRFYVMDTIVMRHEENEIPSCDLSSFTRPSPVVSPAPLTAFAGSCSERGTVVPEIQVDPPLMSFRCTSTQVIIYSCYYSTWWMPHTEERLGRLFIKSKCYCDCGPGQSCDFISQV